MEIILPGLALKSVPDHRGTVLEAYHANVSPCGYYASCCQFFFIVYIRPGGGKTIRSRKFLVIYLISGILGNIVSFAFVPARSLGASGAVLGIGGALLYLWRMNRRVLYGRRRQYLTLVFMVIFNLLYGFGRPGIDNFAHLGGAAAGYLAAGAMGIRHFRESKNKRMFYAAVIVFLSIAGILIGFARFSGYRYGGNFI